MFTGKSSGNTQLVYYLLISTSATDEQTARRTAQRHSRYKNMHAIWYELVGHSDYAKIFLICISSAKLPSLPTHSSFLKNSPNLWFRFLCSYRRLSECLKLNWRKHFFEILENKVSTPTSFLLLLRLPPSSPLYSTVPPGLLRVNFWEKCTNNWPEVSADILAWCVIPAMKFVILH